MSTIHSQSRDSARRPAQAAPPTSAARYGYRFVSPLDRDHESWQVWRDGVPMRATRCARADPNLQSYLRANHPHLPRVIDLIDDDFADDVVWMLQPWLTEMLPSGLPPQQVRAALCVVVGVWCRLRECDLVAFPTRFSLGADGEGKICVSSLGPVRYLGESGSVAAAGWLSLLTWAAHLWPLTCAQVDFDEVVPHLDPTQSCAQMAEVLRRGWDDADGLATWAPSDASDSAWAEPDGEVSAMDAPAPGLAATLVEAAVRHVRGALGAADDLVASVKVPTRRRARRFRPALLACGLCALLVALAVVIL